MSQHSKTSGKLILYLQVQWPAAAPKAAVLWPGTAALWGFEGVCVEPSAAVCDF